MKLLKELKTTSLELLMSKKYAKDDAIVLVAHALQSALDADTEARAAKKDVKADALRQTFTVNGSGNA